MEKWTLPVFSVLRTFPALLLISIFSQLDVTLREIVVNPSDLWVHL